MDIKMFLAPLEGWNADMYPFNKQLYHCIQKYQDEEDFPQIEAFDIVLLGVQESRAGISNSGSETAPNSIRERFYKLFVPTSFGRIVDIGNIKRGNTIEDTYLALMQVVKYVLSKNVFPIILGGTQDLTISMYRAYKTLEQNIHLLTVDSRIDIMDNEEKLSNSFNYLRDILLNESPNYIFDYSTLGYQKYFVDEDVLKLLDSMYFDAVNLGAIHTDIKDVEPIIRNADCMSIDISSIKESEAKGCEYASPNGLTANMLCKITHYAGMSDKLTSLGFFEYNPLFDQNQQTALLIAQAMYYFMEGFFNRKQDFPVCSKQEYTKEIIHNATIDRDIAFYNSPKTNRWWMEIILQSNAPFKNYARHKLVPCSEGDVAQARQGILPIKWIRYYNKYKAMT